VCAFCVDGCFIVAHSRKHTRQQYLLWLCDTLNTSVNPSPNGAACCWKACQIGAPTAFGKCFCFLSSLWGVLTPTRTSLRMRLPRGKPCLIAVWRRKAWKQRPGREPPHPPPRSKERRPRENDRKSRRGRRRRRLALFDCVVRNFFSLLTWKHVQHPGKVGCGSKVSMFTQVLFAMGLHPFQITGLPRIGTMRVILKTHTAQTIRVASDASTDPRLPCNV
jgi:hypothetical protein